MKAVVIDTSTEKSIILFIEKERVLKKISLPVGYQSSRVLITYLEAGFQELKLRPQDLDYVGATQGPGLLTGIRVGIAVAEGLSFGASLPLIGIGSLSSFIADAKYFASVMDARIQGAYVLRQRREGGEIVEEGEPSFIPFDKLSFEGFDV
ncbi:MAG: tRNA (adenosine(37)-N6)-threonylcarbamoyltransferase complex dimerization subunit type 1 TsaB, partial [Chlamydiales bacterium]